MTKNGQILPNNALRFYQTVCWVVYTIMQDFKLWCKYLNISKLNPNNLLAGFRISRGFLHLCVLLSSLAQQKYARFMEVCEEIENTHFTFFRNGVQEVWTGKKSFAAVSVCTATRQY